MRYSVGLPGRDQLELEIEINNSEVTNATLKGVGCTKTLELLVEWRQQLKGSVMDLPLPLANDHSSILMRQLILQVKGLWNPPYQDDELCHCRGISTEKVNNAITSGCHTPESVSKKTSASTACGTCRPDVEAQIHYFTQKK